MSHDNWRVYAELDAPASSDIDPGVYPDMPNAAYHAAPGISNSGLALIARAPALYYGRRLDPGRPVATTRPGQLEGSLAHCAILEPQAFDERYVVGPSVNRNTKTWKAFVADHPHRIAIQREQYDAAWAQRHSVLAIGEVAAALEHGGAELSAFWLDTDTLELCRCRPDWVAHYVGGDILLDIKTYSSAEPREFARQIARKGYYRQDAMYSEGWAQASGRDVLAFVFVAVETEYPYAASAVMLDDESKAIGRAELRRLLDTYAACRRRNEWPGYGDAIEIVGLPHYLKMGY